MTANALGNIDSVRSAPPAGQIVIPGVVRRGDPLIIRGWALEAEHRRTFETIAAVFSNGFVSEGVTGLPRPDVVAAFSLDPAAAPGFTIVAATDTLIAGPQEVTVRGGSSAEDMRVVASFRVYVRPHARALDVEPGVTSNSVKVDPIMIDVRGTVPVSVVEGWALDESTQLPGSRVIVTAGSLSVEAAYGYPRPDVVEALHLSEASLYCGFRVRIPCDEIDAPDVRAHLDTVSGGRYSSASETVPSAALNIAFGPSSPARGHIDSVHVFDCAGSPRETSRTIRVRAGDQIAITGWAALDGVDADVVVLLDRAHRTPVCERIPRADVTKAFPGSLAAGFVTTIDSEPLGPGFHEIELFVRGADGVFQPTAARTVIEVV